MTVKDFLRQYRAAQYKVELLRRDLSELEAMAEGTAIAQDGQPRGTERSDPAGNLATRIADLRATIEWKMLEAMEIRSEIMAVAEQLKDSDLFRIVYLRYLAPDRTTWEEIAEDIHLSLRQTHRKHGEALVELEGVLIKS